MTLVTVQMAAAQAERLLEIFTEIGVKPVAGHGVEGAVLSLREILENLAAPRDLSDQKVINRYVIGAGIHDLAAKITTVWDKYIHARDWLRPHLILLAETNHVNQNTVNERWDRIDGEPREHGSADKVVELYWACLCVLVGMSVELDEPYESSGGRNPDVIATSADGTRWAFALKTQNLGNAANRAINLAQLLNSAAEQILRADCEKGVVVVNLKNMINHDRLRETGAFENWERGRDELEAQVDAHLEKFHEIQADVLDSAFTKGGKLAPVVIFISHATVLCIHPGRSSAMFTEIKAMKARTLPNRYEPAPGTYAAEVKCLAHALNNVVQNQI